MWEAFCHLALLASSRQRLSRFDLLHTMSDQEGAGWRASLCFCQTWSNKAKDSVGWGQHSRPVQTPAWTLQMGLQRLQNQGHIVFLLLRLYLLSPHRTLLIGWKSTKKGTRWAIQESFLWALFISHLKNPFSCRLPSQGAVQSTQPWWDLKVDSSAAVSALLRHTALLALLHGFFWVTLSHLGTSWLPWSFIFWSSKVGAPPDFAGGCVRVRFPSPDPSSPREHTVWFNLTHSPAAACSASPLHFGKISSGGTHFDQSGNFYVDTVDVLEVMWSHWPHLCLASLGDLWKTPG